MKGDIERERDKRMKEKSILSGREYEKDKL